MEAVRDRREIQKPALKRGGNLAGVYFELLFKHLYF
jgi:hypothetical protein